MKPKIQAEKFAKLYDRDVLPLWSRQFGELLLRDLTVPPSANVLDVGCGTGYPALELLDRMDESSRIIAIDASAAMIEEARTKAGALANRRIFFRSENAVPKLSFADDVYDVVLCNATLQEFEDPARAVREFARVTKLGGELALTVPLAGTFDEFYDLFREVLLKLDQRDALERLAVHLARYPALSRIEAWFAESGFADVHSEQKTFKLLFHSGREFFFAPVIEFGPLSNWKRIAGQGPQLQRIFLEIKSAIDTYFARSPFAVTVVAGVVRGKKAAATEPMPDLYREEIPPGALAEVPIDIQVLEEPPQPAEELIEEDEAEK